MAETTTQDAISNPGAAATQRLFFALWPTEALQRQWHRQAGTLLAGRPGQPVAAHNLHLTLVFLGSVTDAIRLCLEQAVADIHGTPFVLEFDKVGYWRKPQVVWLGCSELPAPLLPLIGALMAKATDCGLTPDTRPYHPHMTVARKVRSDPGDLSLTPVSWPVERFALMESVSQSQGVIYRPVREWDL